MKSQLKHANSLVKSNGFCHVAFALAISFTLEPKVITFRTLVICNPIKTSCAQVFLLQL